MPNFDDAKALQRLRDIFAEHLRGSPEQYAEGGPVNTPYLDDGLYSAPNSIFNTPPSDADVNAPAQVYGDGGAVEYHQSVGPVGSKLVRAIRAYHGSPHSFDKFDASKIGSGEGAASFGRGLYFAENPDVASSYRNSLSYATTPEHMAWSYLEANRNDPAAAIEAMRNHVVNPFQGPESTKLIREGMDLLLKGRDPSSLSPPGHMYEVDIRSDPAKFLNWDAPISEQYSHLPDTFGRYRNPNWTGRDLYQQWDRPEVTSREMQEAGIPGIRYLDQGSRGVGEGTSNYVVFPGNEDLVDIRRKYADGGLVDMIGGPNEDDYGAGRFTRTPEERKTARERRIAQHVPESSEEWDRFVGRHKMNPATYGMEALARLESLYRDRNPGQDIADFLMPHTLQDEYGGVSARVGDAVSAVANWMPGVAALKAGIKPAAQLTSQFVAEPLYTLGREGFDYAKSRLGFEEGGPVEYDSGGRVMRAIKTIRNAYGSLQGARAEQAADLTNLERLPTKTILDLFEPKYSSLLTAMPTDAFEDYAPKIPEIARNLVPYPRWQSAPRSAIRGLAPEELTMDNYLDRMAGNFKNAADSASTPSLWLARNPELGLTDVVEHEGRHRMRALNRMGDARGLVQLRPVNEGELRHPLDERLQILLDKYFPQGGKTLIAPQDMRNYEALGIKNPRVPSPIYEQPFADGGAVEYQTGGAVKVARAIKPEIKKLLDRVREPDGGFTWQPFTRDEPSSGYAVAPYPDRSQILPADALDAEALWKYQMRNYDLLRDDKHYLGAWHDPASSNVYLDVSRVGPDLNEIAHVGRAANQKALFDLENFKSLDLGGTGTPIRDPETYGPGFAGGGGVGIKFIKKMRDFLGSEKSEALDKIGRVTDKTKNEALIYGALGDPDPLSEIVRGNATNVAIPDWADRFVDEAARNKSPWFTAHTHPNDTLSPSFADLSLWSKNVQNPQQMLIGARPQGSSLQLGSLAESADGVLNRLRVADDVLSAKLKIDNRQDTTPSRSALALDFAKAHGLDLPRGMPLGRFFAEMESAPMLDFMARRGVPIAMDAAHTIPNTSGALAADVYPELLDFYRGRGSKYSPLNFESGGPVEYHQNKGPVGRSLLRGARRFLIDPLRESYPGIYKDPDVLVREARDHLVPDPGKEGPMYRLFGHTRDSLDELSQGNRRLDSIVPPLGIEHPVRLSGTAAISPNVLTRRNAGRISDIIGEALEDPQLRTTRSWYEMSPLYEHMSRIGTGDAAMKKLNNTMAAMSAGSDPRTEINRGFHANWLANQGRLDDFVRHGGTPDHERGPDFPDDLRSMMGHAYHGSAQVPGLLESQFAGRPWPGEGRHKVPTYAAATDPVFPYSVRPVADSHFNRILGYPDVATAATRAGREGVPTGTQYADIVPWFNKIADNLDIRPRDAQALLWNVGGPQTGVRYIGPSKLEMIADYMDEVARLRQIDPRKARDQLLSGEIGGAWDHGLEAPFAEGGSVDDDFNLYQSQFYARGGPVDDDLALGYDSMYYGDGGPVSGYFRS